MDSALVPCPACDRHVRSSEAACPFCAAELPGDLARRAVPAANYRMGRAAALAFGATLTLTACAGEVLTSGGQGSTSGAGGSTSTTGMGGDTGGGGFTGVPLYGGPGFPLDSGEVDEASAPPDASPDAGNDGAAGDGGGIAPPYGAPPYGVPPMP